MGIQPDEVFVYEDVIMNENKLMDDLNITATTILGTVGALTGNPAIQAGAFLPAVAHKIYTKLSEDKYFVSANINDDLEALLKETCLSTQNILSHESKTKTEFFQYANARIETVKAIANTSDLIKIIQTDLEIEKRSQVVDITALDIKKIGQLFSKTFMDNLHKYPKLQNYFFSNSLSDHEKRITNLEGKTFVESNVIPAAKVILDDKKFYCDKFSETLFLHKSLPKGREISLNDIYTSPKVKTVGQWRETIQNVSYDYAEDAIRDFINYSPTKPGTSPFDVLFIEGQAAVGKSSLIAWLCWHYDKKDKIAIDILGNRQLITIKLRDISRKPANKGALNFQSPFLQFYAYLLKEDEYILSQMPKLEDAFKQVFAKTILVLEGFDELCMVESLFEEGKFIYFQNLSNELARMDCGCKVIVTTRHSYLRVEELDFPKAHLSICPFTEGKRKTWLQKYESKCAVEKDIKDILLRHDTQLLDGIIDSPLTLYMIVSKNVHISEASNLWDIYHQIFAEEVYKRHYEKGTPHDINVHRDLLYQLTAEIAIAVSKEQHLFTTVDRLLGIQNIRQLLDDLHGLDKSKNPNYHAIKKILEECFGLASYFKISEKTDIHGRSKCAVEFYHNNIKDYFCCEYIWINLERIYSNIPNDTFAMEKWFISNFQKMFQYSVFLKDTSEGDRSMAIRFLDSKVRHLKECGVQTDFIYQEIKNHYFQHFMGKMLQTGMLYKYEYTGNENVLNMMACIYAAVFSVYHTIYLPYLADDERIAIAEDSVNVDISTSFIYRLLFITANVKNQTHIKFDGIMFSGIEFGRHDFRYSSFIGCLMIGCDFENVDLRGADFSFASLERADLSKAIIDETTIFKKASFENTRVTQKQLLYLEKWTNTGLLVVDN